MHNFSDFDIKPEAKTFIGDKIPVKKIINIQIKVLDFKIEPSKIKEGTECLYLQIEKGEEKRVVFTGSTILISQIKRVTVDKFPFITTIKGDNDYYEFT
jgi:hypothetical protein